jgi:hypothetical protein
MNKRLTIYALVISLLSLSFAGAALAHWTKVITVTGTVTSGTVSWEWRTGQIDPKYTPRWIDFEQYYKVPKDIGTGSVSVIDGKTLLVELCNVYPMYEGNVQAYVHYTGSVPGRVLGVKVLDCQDYPLTVYDEAGEPYEYLLPGMTGYLRLNDNSDNVFEIEMSESFAQLHYCMTEEVSFFVKALEPLRQDLNDIPDPNCEPEYCFKLEFTVINYNEFDAQHPPLPLIR